MMEAVEEEQPDVTSYILQALNIIKELWTMSVYIGKVTKPSRWTRLLRNLHLQECEDDSRIYLNIRTGIEFRVIVFFLCDYVICLTRPSMTGAVRYNLSLIVQNLNLMDLERDQHRHQRLHRRRGTTSYTSRLPSSRSSFPTIAHRAGNDTKRAHPSRSSSL